MSLSIGGGPQTWDDEGVEAGDVDSEKDSPKAEKRRQKFIEYTAREQWAGQPGRGCLP